MKKVLLVLMIVLTYIISLSASTHYGIKMESKLNVKDFKLDTKDEFPNRKIYRKKLNNDFFDTLTVITDLNNNVYKIMLSKDTIDAYKDATQTLNKLKQQYGNFSCKRNLVSGILYTGDICINYQKNIRIEIETLTLSTNQSVYVSYFSNNFDKKFTKEKK